MAHDVFGIVPVKSITHRGVLQEFSEHSTAEELITSLDCILKGSRKMQTLCDDSYTQEHWVELV